MKRFINDIYKYGKYVIFAAKAELSSEVANAYLDWFWWILEPVCNMLVYYFIFGYVFHNNERYYLVFIYSGITMWTFFNHVVTNSVNIIRHSKSIITKIYIPKPILLIQKMLVCGFKMGISSIIVVILMIPYKVSIDFHVILLLPVILVFFIFTYGIGCILLHFGVYVDDLSYIVSILLKIMVYFTGVFYSVADKFPQPLGLICENINPIAFFIACMRKCLMYKESYSLFVFTLWTIIAITLSVIGTKLVYKNENSYVKVI